jgi:phospholipid transport system substrate-binding protein
MLLLPFVGNAAESPNPTEQMKPFVERVVAQLKDPEFKKDTVDNRIDRIVTLVAEQFDFQEMSKRVVGRPWQTLPPDQRQRFASLFAKLLGYVYINKVDTYLDMKIEFDKERVEGDRAEVKTIFVGADKNILVSYRMILKDGNWMAYDVFIENISVVRNNMEQFKGIAQDQLIPVLERKLQNLKAGKMEQDKK